MTQKKCLELFDFQGTDKEKEELRSCILGLSELPTGRKILERAEKTVLKKPIPLFFKEDDCEWGGGGACYKKSLIFFQPRMKLEKFPEELKTEKKKKQITLMGHELLHLTQKDLHELKNLDLLQMIYRELIVEGEAYVIEEILRAELEKKEIPSFKDKLRAFVTNKIPKNETGSFLYTGFYIDSFIENTLLKKAPLNLMSKIDFQNKVKQILGLGEKDDEFSLKQCAWFYPRPMGGTYIGGNLNMVWLDKNNTPIYACIIKKGEFTSYIYSLKKVFSFFGKRPMFDDEIMAARKRIEKAGKLEMNDINQEQKLPSDIHNTDSFIRWQNFLQSEKLKCLNPQHPMG